MKIQQEIAAMRSKSMQEIRARYEGLFGKPPRSSNKEHLLRRVAWQMQAVVEGGLSGRARRRAAELAKDADLPIAASRKPPPGTRCFTKTPATVAATKRDERLPMRGTVLVRPYRGRMIEVRVLDQGFEYNGQVHKSLTAVAESITGKHWNGYHFFGLRKRG